MLVLVHALLWLALAPARAGSGGLTVDKYRLGEGLRFSSHQGPELRLFAYLQPSVEVKQYTEQPGRDPLARFRLRRLRLRIDGSSPDDRVEFRFQADLAGAAEVGDEASNLLLDAYVSYHVTKYFEIAFGQRATPTDNRELFMLSHTLQLPERSRVTSAFSSIREFGLFASHRLRFGQSQHYLKPYVVITNGDGPNVFLNDRGGLKYGARIDYLPFGLFTRLGQFRQADLVREPTPRLVVGGAYSFNQGMSSRRGRESGGILYLDAVGRDALPDYHKVGVDFLFKYRGFSVLGEYVRTFARVPDSITQRVRNDGSVSEDFDGSVENYVRGRMMLGQGFNVQAGYVLPTNTSIDVRYTRLVPDEHSFLDNGTFYNRETYVTGGLSQYYGARYGLKVQASLTWVDALPGSNDINGEPIPGDELIGRFITTFAL